MNHVVAKEKVVLDDVPNEPAKKRDVASGADRHPNVGERAGARKAWIDMNDGGAAFLCFHDPAKAERMRFGHQRAFDQNAISIGEILLRSRSSAPAERGAQTGHRAAMSYTGLVGYAHHPQAESEQLFDKIILFVVERGAAEMADRSRVIDRAIIDLMHEGTLARFPNAISYHVHRAIHGNFRPFFRARRAILHFRFAARVRKKLIGSRTFRTKISLTNRRFRIALDRNQFSILVKNQLAAANAAVRTNRSCHLRLVDPRVHRARFI